MSEDSRREETTVIERFQRQPDEPNAIQPPRRFALLMGSLLLGWDAIRAFRRRPRAVGQSEAGLQAGMSQEARDADPGRDFDLDHGCAGCAKRRRSERIGTALATIAFLCAMAGGVGFLILYWTGGSNVGLGTALGIAFGGLGFGLALWAHWLIPPKLAVGPREPLRSNEQERAAALHSFRAGEQDVQRRTLLGWLGAGAVGVIAAAAVSLLRSLETNPDTTLYSTVWKRGQRLMTIDGQPMTIHSLQTRSAITVFPEGSIGSEKAQTMLVRVDPALLQLPRERSDWAPAGYVAYSRVCTHAGCPVGMYESRNHLLLCPCHQSTFDVLRAAKPTGGPAARALPQLPLYADADGTLRAADGFSEPPGPGFWGMP